MALYKCATNVMTKKGQSSRWSNREFVKAGSKKARRDEDKNVVRTSGKNSYKNEY